jgi:hypothetical protein
MKVFAGILTVVALVASSSAALGQAVVYEAYSPVVTAAPVAAPVVVESPVVVEAWRPVVTNYRYNPPVSSPGFTAYTSNYGNYGTVTSYYAPVTAYSPVVTETVTSYSPAVTTSYSPVTYSPAVTYSPVVTSYYTPVVVRPRYVPGQPVRNFFRAMGP